MTTPQHRINELTKRQRYDSSSMSVRLNAVDGKWFYNVILFVETDEKMKLPVGGKYGLPNKEIGEMADASIDSKYIITQGKYNGQDPEELIQEAEKIVGKWKCGQQIRKPIGVAS